MNLKELDSFKMSDAVVLHDTLNLALFNDEHLRSDVRAKLLEIAEEFIDYLGVSNLDVKDITISGSNAAYSYTPHSDIDLHIIADLTKFNNDAIYRELFTAKKNLFNADHNIKIKGYDVELYVQDTKKPVRSLGEYSVERNKWIKFPSKKRANLDHNAVENKFKKLVQLGQLALRSNDMAALEDVLSTIKRYRQAGLDEHGEFGPENLVVKALRFHGIIDALYNHRDALKSKQLSLDEMLQEEMNDLPQIVYHVTPAQNLSSIARNGLRPSIGGRSAKVPGEKSAVYCFVDRASLEDALMNWLGDEFDEDEQLALLKIDTTGLHGAVTPNAEYEVSLREVPAKNIKIVTKDIDTHLFETKKFPKLITFNEWSDKNSNKWMKFRENLLEYLIKNGLEQHSRMIGMKCLQMIKKNKYISESFQFEKNSIEPLTKILDFIKKNSIQISKLKIGQRVDIVLVKTMNFAKLCQIDKYKNEIISEIHSTYIVTKSNRKYNIHDLQNVNDEMLDYGVYIVNDDSDEIDTVLFFYEDNIKENGWTIEIKNHDHRLTEASGYISNKSENKRFEMFSKSVTNFKNDVNRLVVNAPSYEQYCSDKMIKENYHQTILRFIWENKDVINSTNDFFKSVLSCVWKSKILSESADINDAKKIIKQFKSLDVRKLKKDFLVDIVIISINTATSVISIDVIPNQHYEEYQIQSDETIMFSADDKIYISKFDYASEKRMTLITKAGQAESGMTMIRLMTCNGKNSKYNDWNVDIDGQNFATRFNNKLNEASGYIPSEKERNDPRFKTALTVDVHPDSIQQNAKKLGSKIARSGVPPTLKASGKI